MLQRCAPLVRALAPGRGAVLLPDSAAYLVALAACEGRAALLLDPGASVAEAARTIEESGARVVFTVERYAKGLPDSMARVLLDEQPGHAEFVHLDERRRVDLGSHFGFSIEGEGNIAGRDEEAVVVRADAGDYRSFTHNELLNAGRDIVEREQLAESDHVLALLPFHGLRGLTAALLAPLLAGARVTTLARFEGTEAIDRLEGDDITSLVGDAAAIATLVSALRQRGRALHAPALRTAIVVGQAIPPKLQAEWRETTAVELREMALPLSARR